MTAKDNSLVSRIRSSFRQLSSRATDLNTLSDQVGKVVARFDAEFNRLNIGIPAWVQFQEWTSEDGLQFRAEEVGYAKIGAKWGLAIRTMSGHEAVDDYTGYQEWLFSDAPRLLRRKAIDKIPELFEKLVVEVDTATKAVDKKLKEIQELATALDPALPAIDKPFADVQPLGFAGLPRIQHGLPATDGPSADVQRQKQPALPLRPIAGPTQVRGLESPTRKR